MTDVELAFRHIAANDFASHRVRRTLSHILALCRRKHIWDAPTIAQLLCAYDDEYRQEEAEKRGSCRHCKVSRPIHWHVEPMVRQGRLVERWIRCTSELCDTPIRSLSNAANAAPSPTGVLPWRSAKRDVLDLFPAAHLCVLSFQNG